jgi:penicillin amidase
MARAHNVSEFKQALTQFDVGSQNFGVADIYGNIGYFTGAEVPIREDLQTMMAPDGVPPMFIRDGTGAHKNEWMPVSNPQANQAEPHEIIPTAEMPQVMNPDKGWFANANNDPIGLSADNNVLNQLRPGGGLYYLSQGGYSTYRMGRIDRLITSALENDGKVDAANNKAWQANNQMLDAELIMPHILTAFNNASANDAWPGIAQFLADPRVLATWGKFMTWDFSSPTGVAEGYDPFENPFALSAPSSDEIDHSVAATIYSTWRSMAIRNTIDATMNGVDAAIGQNLLGPQLPGSKYAFNGFKHLLDSFPENHGIGGSGINFFTNPEAPTPEDARDFIILASLKQALDLLASDEFAPAFANSTDIMDYRWGKLHRIEFSHVLGSSLSVPNGLFGLSTQTGLQGVARSGGYQVLDASTHSVRANTLNGFMFAAGPARRMVATMTDTGPAAEQIIPGGQSGNITDGVLYVNQLFSWLTNDYFPLIVDPTVIGAIAVSTENYEP